MPPAATLLAAPDNGWKPRGAFPVGLGSALGAKGASGSEKRFPRGPRRKWLEMAVREPAAGQPWGMIERVSVFGTLKRRGFPAEALIWSLG